MPVVTKGSYFFGHVINELGISPNPENVEKLVQMKVPRNVREVRDSWGWIITTGNLLQVILK